MKKIFLILVLNVIYCQSQNLNYDKIDEFTGNRKISVIINNVNPLTEYGVSFELIYNGDKNGNSNKYINISFSISKILCFQNSDIILLFEDGSKAIISQISKLECGKSLTISYRLKESDIISLTNLKLKKIRIESTEGYFDADIKEKKKQQIIDGFIKFNMTVPN